MQYNQDENHSILESIDSAITKFRFFRIIIASTLSIFMLFYMLFLIAQLAILGPDENYGEMSDIAPNETIVVDMCKKEIEKHYDEVLFDTYIEDRVEQLGGMWGEDSYRISYEMINAVKDEKTEELNMTCQVNLTTKNSPVVEYLRLNNGVIVEKVEI